MKTGLVSGCITWFILFGIMSACLVPVGLMGAGFTSGTDFVAETVGSYLCPVGTKPELYSYTITIRSTGYELICVNGSGETVVNLGATYAFIWTGVLGGAGAVVAGLLAILLAGPIGVFFAKRFGRKQDSAIGRL